MHGGCRTGSTQTLRDITGRSWTSAAAPVSSGVGFSGGDQNCSVSFGTSSANVTPWKSASEAKARQLEVCGTGEAGHYEVGAFGEGGRREMCVSGEGHLQEVAEPSKIVDRKVGLAGKGG